MLTTFLTISPARELASSNPAIDGAMTAAIPLVLALLVARWFTARFAMP